MLLTPFSDSMFPLAIDSEGFLRLCGKNIVCVNLRLSIFCSSSQLADSYPYSFLSTQHLLLSTE